MVRSHKDESENNEVTMGKCLVQIILVAVCGRAGGGGFIK